MKSTRKKILTLLLTAVMFLGLFALVSPEQKAAAGGTEASDKANTVFFYAYDANGSEVLLKAITLDTLGGMMHGQDGTSSSYYPASFIDAYPTPAYCEGKGVTVSELIDYVTEFSSVAGASSLTYTGTDKLYFTCTDAATANFTAADLLETDRYYFPELYNNWDTMEIEVTNPETVKASGVKYEPYLAVVSQGGRVLSLAGSHNGTIADYVEDNGGVVAGCLSSILSDTYALRLVFFQTENDIDNSSPTYGNVKKWIYMIRLKESGTSLITSLGTVSQPEITYTLNGTTLTVTMSCPDSDASIYYSNIGGYTSTPVNLYTDPITIENYDTNAPFTLGVQAVREGYVSSAKITKASSELTEPDTAPAFTYALAGDTSAAQAGTPISLEPSLTADKDYNLYSAEYQLAVPSADFSVDSVTPAGGWQAQSAVSGMNNVITFTYLDTAGTPVAANAPVSLGTFTVTPLSAGEKTFTVTEAVVTKEDAQQYGSVTAPDTTFTVADGSTVIKGDVNGSGTVTIADVILLRKYLAGAITLTTEQLDAADFNDSGTVSIADLIQLRKYLAG